jgi:hypothetical protein
MKGWLKRPARAAAVFLVVLVGSGLSASSASAYWDFSGWLYPRESYMEGAGTSGSWYIRMNRQYCEAKMQLRYRGTNTWDQVEIPGGCATTDYKKYFSRLDFDAARCIVQGYQRVWVNCRIAAE